MSPPRFSSSIIPLPVLAALGLAAALIAPGARAQDDSGGPTPAPPRAKKKPPPVNMVIEVGQENNVRLDRTNPITVTLINNDKAVTGYLELRDTSGRATRTPIDLPRGAQKYYTLFARLQGPSNSLSSGCGEVILQAGGRTLDHQELKPRYVPSEATLVLSATGTREGTGLKFLEDGSTFRIRNAAPRDLPKQWPGYEPSDVVVMNGQAWAEMDPEQQRALRIWVEQGGRAILCGDRAAEWRDPEGQALAGVAPRDELPLRDLDCVSAWGGLPYHARSGGLMTISGPPASGSEVEFAEQGRPLIVRRTAVLGRVIWLGFDPFQQTFRDWDGSASFWKRALQAARTGAGSDSFQNLDQVEAVKGAVSALPRLPAPPLGAIIGFGVVYALIFGPLNIWMLRRLRRTVRSWLFTPSLAAAMTLVALLVGQNWGNARTVLNGVSILQGQNGGRTAVEQSLIFLFSPTNRAFDLQCEDPWPQLVDLGGADPREPAGSQARLDLPDRQNEGLVSWDAVALQLYSTRRIRLRRPADLGGSVEVRLQPARGGRAERYLGAVRNGAYFGLKNACLCHAGRYHWLGDIPSGKQVSVSGKDWSNNLKEPAAEVNLGELQENRAFRESAGQLRKWLAARSDDAMWLVAECPDHRASLEVARLPYSNRATFLLVRVPNL